MYKTPFHKSGHSVYFRIPLYYWEATSKFGERSVCIEGMIYHMSQDFWGESGNLGGISPPNSPEINTELSSHSHKFSHVQILSTCMCNTILLEFEFCINNYST